METGDPKDMREIVEPGIGATDCISLEEMISTSIHFGYTVIMIDHGLAKCIEQSPLHSKTEVLFRIDIDVSSPGEIKKAVREAYNLKKRMIKKGFKLVLSLRPTTLQALRATSHLHGFEIVRVTPQISRYMDRSQAKMLASRGDVTIEIPLPQYMPSRRSLHQLYVTLRKMFAYDVPFILSSDAKRPEKLWSPRMKVGLMMLMGVPEKLASIPVYSYPHRLLQSIRDASR